MWERDTDMAMQEMVWLEAQSPDPGVRLSGFERQLLLVNSETLGKCLSFSGPQFPHL